jgi:hypothetical protein
MPVQAGKISDGRRSRRRMKLRIGATPVCLALTIIFVMTFAVAHSQRPQQQTNRVETQELAILQLAQKPKVPVDLVSDIPSPPGDLSNSMKARRDYAWEIVKLVWHPVTVQGGKVPRWMTWYEQEEIEEMYNEMLYQRPKPKTHAEIVAAADAVMAKHSVKDLQASVNSARLGKVLRQFTFPALLNISHHVANGAIYYSPSYVKHLLENADNVERCNLSASAQAGPPAQCAPIVSEINSLEAERASIQKDLQKAAGPEKQGLVAEIRQITAQIMEKQRELNKCSADAEKPSGNVWAKCMDSEMPADAFMIKANWARKTGYLTKPLMGGATGGPGGDPDEITGELNSGRFISGGLPYETTGMLIVTDENGKKWMLTGMHIASKAVRTWLWTSLFWGATSLSHGGWAADQPQILYQQWPRLFDYGMCTVSGFEENDPTPWKAYADGDIFTGKQPLSDALKAVAKVMNGTQWCANPFIETDTARTNCIGCHQGSTESFLLTVSKERSTNISDFSFSFATNRGSFLKARAAHP